MTWCSEVVWHSGLGCTFNSSSQSTRIGTLDCVENRAILEDHEGWHGSNAIFARDLLLVVDIDFGKCDGVGLAVLGGELLVDWRDSFTWTAPVCINCDERSALCSDTVAWKGYTNPWCGHGSEVV